MKGRDGGGVVRCFRWHTMGGGPSRVRYLLSPWLQGSCESPPSHVSRGHPRAPGRGRSPLKGTRCPHVRLNPQRSCRKSAIRVSPTHRSSRASALNHGRVRGGRPRKATARRSTTSSPFTSSQRLVSSSSRRLVGR